MVTDPEASDRLAYRRWSSDDAPFILDMYSREDVYRYLGAVPSPMRTIDEARERIERWAARSSPGRGLWAIEAIDDEAPIGTVLLVPLPRSDGAPGDVMEVGWHLHPTAWGHGYATEAATTVIEMARTTGVTDLRAVVFPANTASIRVCERLGLTPAGLTREWYGVELAEFRWVDA
jgi:RimJ/RimL family protein N-acetyltransferase